MRITSEIFQVGGEGFTSSQDASIFLIKIGTQLSLIDSGCGFGEETLKENIEETGADPNQIQLLLLTHCHYDHTGGAPSLRSKYGCKIIAHELDASFLEAGDNEATAATWYGARINSFKIDRKLKRPLEVINVAGREIEAYHIPGHSPGSLAFLMESDGKRVLFGQDVHGPLHPSLHSDRKDYEESLKKLISLEADILCEGHYGIIEGKKKVIDFIQSFI